jgi:hypothetical protein
MNQFTTTWAQSSKAAVVRGLRTVWVRGMRDARRDLANARAALASGSVGAASVHVRLAASARKNAKAALADWRVVRGMSVDWAIQWGEGRRKARIAANVASGAVSS